LYSPEVVVDFFSDCPVSGCAELCTGFEAEQLFQIKFANKGIDGGLTVITLYLGEDQPCRVTVVAAAHVCLDSQ
jgi:hypothetical protein